MFHYWENMGIEEILSKLGLHYEKINAEGHENIKATHKTTLEITKEDYLTPRGTCIIAVKADKSVGELSTHTKNLLRQSDNRVFLIICVDDELDIVEAHTSPRLILKSPTSLVIRKSDYVDDRTLAIKADKSAKDLKRHIIQKLRQKALLQAYVVITQKQIKSHLQKLYKNPSLTK